MKPKSTKVHLSAATLILVTDALILGQGVATTLIAVWMVAINLISIATGLRKKAKNPEANRAHLVGIYATLWLSVIAVITANNQIATMRAESVISAIKLYKENHQQYPETLSALTPDLLQSIPRAKFTLTYHSFEYHRLPNEDVIFFYTTLPPFRRRTYDFKNDRWMALD